MYEDVFRPNVTVCAATEEEFKQICEAATQLGLSLCGDGGILNPYQYSPGDTDALYVSREMVLQYTNKDFALHEDEDFPEVIDWGDLGHPEIRSIDDLM